MEQAYARVKQMESIPAPFIPLAQMKDGYRVLGAAAKEKQNDVDEK
jgi:hypothetical protein